ncbi:MAG: hypothetical protein ACE14W_01220 [Candidatus Velamenicoccus archaeovorus]
METSSDRPPFPPLPDDDPLVKSWGEPGETFWGNFSCVDWGLYLDGARDNDRDRVVKFAERQVIPTDRRLFILRPAERDAGFVPLRHVRSVELATIPGKPFSRDRLVKILFRDETGKEEMVRWFGRRRDMEDFITLMNYLANRPGYQGD